MKLSKTLTIILSIVGIVAIIGSIIWITVIEPRFEKLPTDLDETFVIDATVTDVFPTAGETQVKIERHQWATDDKDGVLYISEQLTFTPEIPAILFEDTTLKMAVDRSSREFVSDYADGDRNREALWGYPMDVKKKDYVLWSDTAGSAPYARYAGEDEIDGLDVYTFITDEKDIEYGTHPGTGLPLFIDLVIEEKVEPHTGITVFGKSTRTVKVELAGKKTTAMIITQEYSPETTAAKVSDAKHYKTMLLWATNYSLWIGFGLGILSLLAAGVLVVRSRFSGFYPSRSERFAHI
jgi:hypothetical protein